MGLHSFVYFAIGSDGVLRIQTRLELQVISSISPCLITETTGMQSAYIFEEMQINSGIATVAMWVSCVSLYIHNNQHSLRFFLSGYCGDFSKPGEMKPQTICKAGYHMGYLRESVAL